MDNDKLWADWHGKLDRIADGTAGGQMKNFDDFIQEIRLDTLRQVLPKKEWFIYLQESLDDLSREQLEENSVRVGINTCIDKIEAKAKELWGIDLIN